MKSVRRDLFSPRVSMWQHAMTLIAVGIAAYSHGSTAGVIGAALFFVVSAPAGAMLSIALAVIDERRQP